MKSLGADHVIDYTKEDFTKSGLQYDLILDVKVYRSVFDYRRALRSGGSLVVVGGSGGPVFKVIIFGRLMSMFGKKRMGFVIYKPNKDLAQLADLIEARKVVPIIDRRYPLSEVGEAIRHLGDGHVKGKIVITMEHNDKN
jgi:NADPH:quinone reductase-like Zn-dependent oxidoreductase